MANQVFLFYGDEDLLIKERINQLKLQINDPSLNLEQLDCAEPDLEKIVAALQTQPLLFGSKLLIIKNADLRAKEWGPVLPALKNIPSGTTVVIWAVAVDKRSKIFKQIDDIGEVYEFRSFAEWEQDRVVAWIRQRTKAEGKEIDQAAAISLQEICGNGLMKLSSEIEKLITYIGGRQMITTADVEALASPGQISVFVLSDAIARKDLVKSLSAWRTLQRNRFELFPILAMLANRYRIMLLGKTVKDPMKIAQTLKTSPYYVKKCLSSAARFTQAELKNNLELMLEADLKLKSGGQQLPTFELLLTSLCGK